MYQINRLCTLNLHTVSYVKYKSIWRRGMGKNVEGTMDPG